MKRTILALSALLLAPMAFGQAGAAQTQTLHGTVVNYLSTIGTQGGVVANNPGQGGITVNSKNASIHTTGSSMLVQPLGLKANGQVYLLDVSNKHSNVVSRLANDEGKNVSVKGTVVQRDGANLLIVDSVS